MGKFHRTKVNSATISCSYCNKNIKKNYFAFRGVLFSFTSAWYCREKCVKESGNMTDRFVLGWLLN
jgi:hypothetical protein